LKFQNLKKQSNVSETTENPEWLKNNNTREETEMFLSNKDIGVFVVRKSESIQNCYVLSVKVPKYINPTFIAHYLIEKSSKKSFKLRGSTQKFEDLSTLIEHCSIERDILPIILNMDYYEHKQDIVQKLSTIRCNEFLYYSSGSSIASSNFTEDTCSSVSSLPSLN
jgi:hypothetical protein